MDLQDKLVLLVNPNDEMNVNAELGRLPQIGQDFDTFDTARKCDQRTGTNAAIPGEPIRNLIRYAVLNRIAQSPLRVHLGDGFQQPISITPIRC